MNLSAIPDDRWYGKLVRLPARVIPPTAELRILKGRLRGKRWIVGSSTHGAWLGSYDQDTRTIFEALVAPGSVVYDIGAHAGFFTLLGADLVGPSGRVVAFEPSPHSLDHLRTHLELNAVDGVQVIEAAVSATTGTARFEESPESLAAHLSNSGGVTVSTVTLDELTAAGTIPDPDTIKINAEGAEADVIRGGHATIKRSRPTVLLSTHGPEIHGHCVDTLSELGYELTPIGAAADKLLARPRWA